MASITIRNLDESLKGRLRLQAALEGRSMEDQAREILRTALANPEEVSLNLAAQIHRRFEVLGGVELEIPRREPMRDPPAFDP
jgi:plasmid stability protein